MKVETKLINRPRRQPAIERTLFGAATLMAWSVYLYLWAPLATFALWLAGVRTSYITVYLERNQVNVTLLVSLVGIAVGCAVVLLGWAEYNRIRFQGKDRRGRQPNATIPEVASALRASISDAMTLQSARVATVRMSETAEPLAVLLGSLSATSTAALGPTVAINASATSERPASAAADETTREPMPQSAEQLPQTSPQ